jgi:hypothetical protein
VRRDASKMLDGEYQFFLERFVEGRREMGDKRVVLDNLPEIIVEEVCRREGVLITGVRYDTGADVLLIGE